VGGARSPIRPLSSPPAQVHSRSASDRTPARPARRAQLQRQCAGIASRGGSPPWPVTRDRGRSPPSRSRRLEDAAGDQSGGGFGIGRSCPPDGLDRRDEGRPSSCQTRSPLGAPGSELTRPGSSSTRGAKKLWSGVTVTSVARFKPIARSRKRGGVQRTSRSSSSHPRSRRFGSRNWLGLSGGDRCRPRMTLTFVGLAPCSLPHLSRSSTSRRLALTRVRAGLRAAMRGRL
jgi:hypothetical protein